MFSTESVIPPGIMSLGQIPPSFIVKLKKRFASYLVKNEIIPQILEKLKNSCMGCAVQDGSQIHHACLGFYNQGIVDISEILEDTLKKSRERCHDLAEQCLGGFFNKEELGHWVEQWANEEEFKDLLFDIIFQKHVSSSLVIRGRIHPYVF